jgi:hypothetical protein
MGNERDAPDGATLHSLHKGSGRGSAIASVSSGPEEAAVAPESDGYGDAVRTVWSQALRTLRRQMSAAAFSAWIEPLRPVLGDPAGAPGAEARPAVGSAEAQPPPLILTCESTFQRDQILRRYRRLVEAAAGCPVDLVVPEMSAAIDTPPSAVSAEQVLPGTVMHDNEN